MTYDSSNDNHKERNREYQRQWYSRNKEKQIARVRESNLKRLQEIKDYLYFLKSSGCSRCPEKDPICIDFHHLNSDEKLFSIGNGITRYSFDKIKLEVAKCVLLCSNCHRKLHHSYGAGG